MRFKHRTILFSVGIFFSLVFAMAASTGSAFCFYCDNPGVGSPGYWKNHPEAWPVDSLVIGIGRGPFSEEFTKGEAIAAMMAPVAGDKTYTMFPALVAAKLNILIGNCDCDGFNPWYMVGMAQDWFSFYPLGSGVTGDSEAWQFSHGEWIYEQLDAYNNGELCAFPRD